MLRLLPFYLTYRAMVRAKVAGIRLGQEALSATETAQARQEFGSYLDLAVQYTRPSQPRLWITHGVSGSGKTVYTQQVLEATGAIRLRSDVERKRLFGIAPLERSSTRPDLALYDPDVTQRTYAQLAQLAILVIQAGFTAIVDATFLQRAQRDAFRRLATQLGVPFTILDFRAHPDTLRRRVARRYARADDASEAELAILDRQLATREALTADEQACTLPIDTDTPQGLDRLFHTVRALTGQR
jgi:predicted kinase